jgi:hypothetical protein
VTTFPLNLPIDDDYRCANCDQPARSAIRVSRTKGSPTIGIVFLCKLCRQMALDKKLTAKVEIKIKGQ